MTNEERISRLERCLLTSLALMTGQLKAATSKKELDLISDAMAEELRLMSLYAPALPPVLRGLK